MLGDSPNDCSLAFAVCRSSPRPRSFAQSRCRPPARFNSYLKERRNLRRANFDVLVLIQAKSLAKARKIQGTTAFQALIDTLRNAATDMYLMLAHNARCIGDVDTGRRDLFLFNHFAADGPDLMPELWEYFTG